MFVRGWGKAKPTYGISKEPLISPLELHGLQPAADGKLTKADKVICQIQEHYWPWSQNAKESLCIGRSRANQSGRKGGGGNKNGSGTITKEAKRRKSAWAKKRSWPITAAESDINNNSSLYRKRVTILTSIANSYSKSRVSA